jgi:hypothetical protein
VSVVYVYTNFLSNALPLFRGKSGKPRVEKSGFIIFKKDQKEKMALSGDWCTFGRNIFVKVQ